jgi:bleomycin hydrolase
MAGGKTFTPRTYAESLLLNMDDYILLSSFSHHSLYEKFIIEIPDNWSWGEVYNVSLDELTDVIDHSLASGFTVAWAADVSEKDFSRTTGIATVWLDESAEPSFILNEDQTLSQIAPLTEKDITREMRQVAFDNYSTTDDHGMHIIGIATDKYGKELYIVKNSWGADSGPHKGYYFVSKAYVRYKTTSLMVRKDALPDEVALKLFR